MLLNTWTEWLSIIASCTTIISFILYIRERHLRRNEQLSKEKIIGFLKGIKSNSESFSKSGKKWQYNVGKGKSNAFHAESTANIMING